MLICAAALSVLWRFRLSALDQWLMVVMVALLVELTLTALFGGLRPRLFTVGFYMGRIFSLVTATAVLTGLIAETAGLYARLARANMLVELAHANRVATMGQLTASIAHEVTQPIAALLTNAETTVRWLAIQPPNFEKAKQSIDRIISDGKRAADIVSRIRGFSKNAPVRTESLQVNEQFWRL
jgi:signal transduction histidine kinase